MKNKFSHIPLLIFAIAILLVVISLYGYMYGATGASVDRAGTAIDFLVNEQNNASKAKMLTNLASSTLANRNELNTFFVSSDNIVSFITAIEALGPHSGSTLSITSIDADSLTNAATGTIGSAHAHVSAHGSWVSVMRLLNLAEDMPYIISVSHVRLDSVSTNPKSANTWNASFDIQVSIMK